MTALCRSKEAVERVVRNNGLGKVLALKNIMLHGIILRSLIGIISIVSSGLLDLAENGSYQIVCNLLLGVVHAIVNRAGCIGIEHLRRGRNRKTTKIASDLGNIKSGLGRDDGKNYVLLIVAERVPNVADRLSAVRLIALGCTSILIGCRRISMHERRRNRRKSGVNDCLVKEVSGAVAMLHRNLIDGSTRISTRKNERHLSNVSVHNIHRMRARLDKLIGID